MLNYYLHRGGQVHGPYSDAQMKELVMSGRVARSELICPEGGTEWVPASTLLARTNPSLMAGPPATISRPEGNRVSAIAQKQVVTAYQMLKLPLLGMLFSVALPLILWAAKSDAERGVSPPTGRRRALKELAKQNTDLLPMAIVIGLIGVTLCAVWFFKSLSRAKALKAEFIRQQSR